MGPGGIATIIAASSLLVIAIAISYAVIRVGRFIDEARASLKAVTEETTPLIEEVHTTVTLVNGPLQSFNRITKNVEDISDSTFQTLTNPNAYRRSIREGGKGIYIRPNKIKNEGNTSHFWNDVISGIQTSKAKGFAF